MRPPARSAGPRAASRGPGRDESGLPRHAHAADLTAGRPRLIGADASHAWVSVYAPGFANDWVDFDPTNNLLGGNTLIRVGVARDPSQAAPITSH